MTLHRWLSNGAAVKTVHSLLLEVHGLLLSSPDWYRTAFYRRLLAVLQQPPEEPMIIVQELAGRKQRLMGEGRPKS